MEILNDSVSEEELTERRRRMLEDAVAARLGAAHENLLRRFGLGLDGALHVAFSDRGAPRLVGVQVTPGLRTTPERRIEDIGPLRGG